MSSALKTLKLVVLLFLGLALRLARLPYAAFCFFVIFFQTLLASLEHFIK